MPAIVPTKRPEIGRPLVESLLKSYGVDPQQPAPVILGRRSYYRDTMGRVGKNDRGIYDDAIALVTRDTILPFNGNCDPSVGRPGMAVLEAGVWTYKLGIHNISKDPALHPHYPALVQASEVAVLRDGGKHDIGFFGINIHRGSLHSTSSEGCQTVYPDQQWDEFIGAATAAMHAASASTIYYVLTEREDI